MLERNSKREQEPGISIEYEEAGSRKDVRKSAAASFGLNPSIMPSHHAETNHRVSPGLGLAACQIQSQGDSQSMLNFRKKHSVG